MEETNYTETELQDMAAYLISLYYKTDCKYNCSRPKINRLLTIYLLCNINKKPITKNIFCITNSYIGLSGMFTYVPVLEPYTKFEYKDDRLEIIEDFNDQAPIPPLYKRLIDVIELSKAQKKLLEKIFRKFASYDINSLAEKVNEFKRIIPFKTHEDYRASLRGEDLLYFLQQNKNNYLENEILTFIKEYHGIYPSKTKRPLKEQASNNRELSQKMLEKCKRIIQTPKEKRIDELTELLEIIDELSNLENYSLEELVYKVQKKRSLKK